MVDFLVPGEMELQTGALEDEPLQLNDCGVVVHCGEGEGSDDLDMNFLSALLQPDNSSRLEFLPTSNNDLGDSSPTADNLSSDAADTSSGTEELATRPKRAKKMLSSASSSGSSEVVEAELEPEQEGRQVDRKARRRAQVASSARRLRCRKKVRWICGG